MDPTPFAYLFTKYDIKYANRLCKQFAAKYKQLNAKEKADITFSAFVKDIQSKTDPIANIVNPLDGSKRASLLSEITKGQWYENPRTDFSFSVSESTQAKLHVQLQLSCQSIRKALDRNNVSLVAVKLRQLVELGNLLPDAASFANEAIHEVTNILERYEVSFSKCLKMCKDLRDNGDLFKSELNEAKEIIDKVVIFQPVLAMLDGTSSISIEYCTKSINSLTDHIAERVFLSSMGTDVFISQLRDQTQDAIVDLCRLKDTADTFASLSDIFPRPMQIYLECKDALVSCIANELEGTYKRLSSESIFSSEEDELHAIQADFELYSIFDALLKADCLDMRDAQPHHDFWRKAMMKFGLNLQNKVTDVYAQMKSKDPKKMVDMDLPLVKNIRHVFNFLLDHPDLASTLPNDMNEDVSLHTLDSSLHSFVRDLVNKIDADYRSAKEEEDEDRLNNIQQDMANATRICNFCCSEISPISEFEKERIRLIELDKDITLCLTSLSAERKTMLDEANQYLLSIENPSPVDFVSLSSSWNRWIEELEKAPLNASSSSGMISRLLSKVRWTSSSSPPKESKFVRELKRKMEEITVSLRSRLRRCCNDICKGTKSPSAILFVVSVVAMEKTALITSMLASSAEGHDRLHQLYMDSQDHLFQYYSSFCIKNILEGKGGVILNEMLNSTKNNVSTWISIKAFAEKIDPKDDSQQQLRNCLLAFKDYPSQCQTLRSHFESIKSTICECVFLDSAKARSINEHDHQMFYLKVIQSLSLFDEINLLQDHLAINDDDLRSGVLKHVRSQIEAIHSYLSKLMKSFPSIESDYKELSIWRSNLDSIDACFQTSYASVAGIASRSGEDIDREMKLTLKRIDPPDDIPKLIPLLLSLKKSSLAISCYRTCINGTIDAILLSLSKAAVNSGRFILDVKLALDNVEDSNKATALQILSQHKCFQGAMNAVFNSATARQGIDYVIREISLDTEGSAVLRSMYSSFEDQYEGLIKEGLDAFDKGTLDSYFDGLVKEVRAIANDYSIDYRSQLTRITAGIFAYWSMQSTNDFVVVAMSADNKDTAASDYLMQPHAAQVVSIWLLLNFEHAPYQVLENHFVEILTGEGKYLTKVLSHSHNHFALILALYSHSGKSIALGVTAIILALFDCDVVCICYSAYLSSRDNEAFRSLFAAFGVLKSIKYCTAEQACEDLYNSGGDTREISSDIAWGKKAKYAGSETNKARAQVLLIDEVDVFFKDDFYGKSYSSVTTLQQEAIRQLMQYIWKNRDDINQSSLAASRAAQTCLELFPEDIQPIISKHIKSMLKDAKKLDSHDYIVSDGKICYKEFDGLTSRTVYGYSTAFAAMKEHENGRVTDDHLEYRLGISLDCGESSYAELPNCSFDVLLGVTGTLKSLGNDVRDILTQQYGVKRTTYIPSVYGKNKLLFSGDNPRGKPYDNI